MQSLLHYFLHLVFPGIMAYSFFRERWRRVYLIFLATMIVDIDHLLASTIFDPCRCSIGFHPMHSYIACVIYIICIFFPRVRLIALGLTMHMLTDGIDCVISSYRC